MSTYLIAMTLILLVMSGWIGVQRLARRFAARHPEFGPARECFGCGLGCACEEKDTTDFAARHSRNPRSLTTEGTEDHGGKT